MERRYRPGIPGSYWARTWRHRTVTGKPRRHDDSHWNTAPSRPRSRSRTYLTRIAITCLISWSVTLPKAITVPPFDKMSKGDPKLNVIDQRQS